MINFDPLINTCYILTNGSIRSLAFYSHLIPAVFVIALSLLVFVKSQKDILSKIFLAFSLVFSFWLIFDLITWVSNNYFLVYSTWSPIDYFEILFYLLGLYFIVVFSHKKDIKTIYKIIIFILTIIPFILTITQKSLIGFNYPVCEALNNNFLLNYRFYLELVVLLFIFIYSILPFIKKDFRGNKKTHLFVTLSMFIFLFVFSMSTYLATTTAFYEINLYALFLTPIFLIFIIYSIFSLDIFNLRVVSTYFIVFGFFILTASQLFFIKDNTNKVLTIFTLVISIALIYLLFKNLKKESDQRLRIEKLSVDLEQSNLKLESANEKLKGLDKLKTEFVSLASHQLRSPLTAIKGYSSMLSDGDYGKLSKKAQDAIERIFQSSKNLTIIVEDLLNVTKIEAGGMKYEMIQFDLNQLVKDEVKDFLMITEKKGLKLNFEENNELYMVYGDKEKIRQIIINLVDNSIKYTKEGSISISVKNKDNKIIFSVKDTGMGMTEEIKESLFHKFARGEGARMNTTGSGLGLYLAKQIVIAHKGRIWVESEGMGKGSTFFMELDQVK